MQSQLTRTKSRLPETLDRLSREIEKAYAFADRDYVIFGSASLCIRGILDREPGDIDIFMTKKLWGALLPNNGWFVETPAATHPPILSNETYDIHIHAFFDWSNEFCEMNVAELIRNKESVWYDHWVYPVVTVQEALRVKEQAAHLGGHTKHLPDIEIINKWLAKTN